MKFASVTFVYLLNRVVEVDESLPNLAKMIHSGPSYTIPDCSGSVVVFISYWASCYTTPDIQRFDNHCASHSALQLVYYAPIAIRYSVTDGRVL